ncbi:MAG: hypothetical protein LBI06_02205, partial [Treponema sp.]|nr:hypothetical protein [Treponema sp.]
IVSRLNDTFYDRRPLLTFIALILLSAAAIPMFVFSPKVYIEPNIEAENIQMVKINSAESSTGAFGREFILRIYGKTLPNRPLIFLIPPELGSAGSVDLVCKELYEKGFTVITYSRKGYDVALIDEYGRNHSASPAKVLEYLRIYNKAASNVSANEQGKTLEAERWADIEFLLPRLPELLGKSQNEQLPPLVLVGYGAGGSALARGTSFAFRHFDVVGIVAIESQLWSSYLPESRSAPESSLADGAFRRFWSGLSLQTRQVSRTGSLPDSGFPLLYLISGRALDSGKGRKMYQAVFDCLQPSEGFNSVRTNPSPIAIAAIEGAGPLDYQDYPLTHPLYSFLLPGLKNAGKTENPVSDTAGIIGNFASLLLRQAGQTGIIIPRRQAISGSLYVESKGFPFFRLTE